MNNIEKIEALCNGALLDQVFVIEALRLGLAAYQNEEIISDDEIAKGGWWIVGSPEMIRKHMGKLLEKLDTM